MGIQERRATLDRANGIVINAEAQYLVKIGKNMQINPHCESTRKAYIKERRRIFPDVAFDHEEVFVGLGRYTKGKRYKSDE